MSTPTKFKVGDWVFCEFNLQIIDSIKDGRITGVSDGHFTHGSHSLNDRCFPLEKTVKVISDIFKDRYDEIHRKGGNGLNYPDINRWFVEKWCEVCTNREDVALLNKGMEELAEFANAILDRCRSLKNETVGGVNLFRK